MILAQYTIRSKQDYIFKTNRVLEIVGASENIARIWERLFEAADEASLKYERADKKFSMAEAAGKFKKGTLNFIELFCGGGNETILFDCNMGFQPDDSFRKLNRAFSYKLIEQYPGMIPMVVYVKATGDYSKDYKSLMDASEVKRNVMEPQWDMFTVPFAMMDRNIFQPYSTLVKINGQDIRMSDESGKKYAVGKKLRDGNEDIRLFDEMVTQKGKESLLAVVHADGNNMRAKIMEMLHNEADYDKAVSLMREFTGRTADCFEVQGDAALKKCQSDLEEKNAKAIKDKKLKKSSLAYRRLIGSGDDVTFVCNARFAMDYVKAYLDSVQNYSKNTGGEWDYSSCAGICIFHSHYPFSRAYSIAEQACDDGAKQKVHVVDDKGRVSVVEQGWMDFHFIQSGIGGDLSEIRRNQGTKDCIARPWLVSHNDETIEDIPYRYDRLLALKDIIVKHEVSKARIKTVGSAYERSESAAKKELISLYGHTPGLEEGVKKIFKDEQAFLKALYDLAEIYDLWYTEVE